MPRALPALGPFLCETVLLVALSQQRLLMQNRAQQRSVDLDMPVVADEAQFAKLVHEMADSGSSGADHLPQRFLTDVGIYLRRAAFLSEMGEQQEQPRKPPLARIEQLVDQILLNPAVPA